MRFTIPMLAVALGLCAASDDPPATKATKSTTRP